MDTIEPKNPASQNMLMGIFAYLGPLVVIPLLVAKEVPFVKFHIKQGLVLFSIEVILWVASSVFWPLWMLAGLVNLGVFVLSIVGIVNVVQNRENKLPLVGDFSRHFTF